ncbi:MAG: hypothetical protein ACUVUQ_10575, partial [Thermodesulfovibrionales bacterium]
MIGATKGDIAKTKAIEELLTRGIEMVPTATTLKQEVMTPTDKHGLGAKPPVKAQQSVVVRDFTFILENCKHGGTSVACNLKVINNAPTDRKLTLYIPYYGRSTTLFGNFGNEYGADEIVIGNKSSRGFTEMSYFLVKGVPTGLRITSRISPNAE